MRHHNMGNIVIVVLYCSRHVSSNDRLGKRYRETKPVFSIEDDDEDAGRFFYIKYIICKAQKVKVSREININYS